MHYSEVSMEDCQVKSNLCSTDRNGFIEEQIAHKLCLLWWPESLLCYMFFSALPSDLFLNVRHQYCAGLVSSLFRRGFCPWSAVTDMC